MVTFDSADAREDGPRQARAGLRRGHVKSQVGGRDAFRAKTLGPPTRLVLAWLADGAAKTSSIRASGKPTVTTAAAANHLTTGLPPTSGTGGNHRDLREPGAQPMQTAHLTSRKTPKAVNGDLSSAGRGEPVGDGRGMAARCAQLQAEARDRRRAPSVVALSVTNSRQLTRTRHQVPELLGGLAANVRDARMVHDLAIERTKDL